MSTMLKSCGIVLVGKKIITTDSNNWCLLVLSCLGSTTFNNNSNIRQQKPSGCLCPEIRYPPLNWYISKGVASARNMKLVWSHASTDIDKARLLAAASPHSGDSLAAPPITSVGLRYQLLTDWVAKRANHTHAAVEKWWAHVDFIGWPVGKAPKTATPFTSKRHHLVCNEKGQDFVSQQVSGPAPTRQQTP